MDLDNQSLKLIVIDRHIIFLKNWLTYEYLEKASQEVMYSSKPFYSNHMEFVGYDMRDKLIWSSGEGSIITNTIIKQRSPKTHTNKVSYA